jgi:hypothetical protein
MEHLSVIPSYHVEGLLHIGFRVKAFFCCITICLFCHARHRHPATLAPRRLSQLPSSFSFLQLQKLKFSDFVKIHPPTFQAWIFPFGLDLYLPLVPPSQTSLPATSLYLPVIEAFLQEDQPPGLLLLLLFG